ncbi:hypothetical protein SAMN06265365_13430 [Tistlia consotensis]|uniref:Uncharacterized protein n=1 Tax=Tistlia consotensis USBA 355 TaxID=560819 RepID=A0A1Y6CW23_9PROT|nr:hypothetical protein [Tistlia consotensis]SMF78958.1 hypothetical protein SAMN05428998_13930 [Tistlia consotensis USBA 355]SNS15398.1 hypothetical protein SAMN06265365_13430 [Tistlia consotensis]
MDSQRREATREGPKQGPREGRSGNGVALAALSICESLLISLMERGLLDEAELEEVLESARDANLQAEPGPFSRGDHAEAAALLRQILVRCRVARPDRRP